MHTIQESWDTKTEFYSGLQDPQLEEDRKQARQLVKDLQEQFSGVIKDADAQTLKQLFGMQDKLSYYLNKQGIFYLLTASKHGEDLEVNKAQRQFEQFTTNLSNELLFIDEEFRQMGSERLRTLAAETELEPYKGYLLRKARTLQHQLDATTEHALNLKELSGSSAFTDLYDQMNASFVFRPVIDGETQELTDPEVRMLRKHPEEEKRKEALRAMREVFSDKEHLITFGSAYQAIVKDWTSDVSLRDFSSVMEPRNLDEDLDNEVVDTLLSEVEQSYGLYQRYLKLKAGQLGKERLQHWDLHASLAKKEREVPFTQAVEKMLETYKGFDAEFHDYARKMLENGQVDVYPQKGKRGGAFAVFEKGFESYVMLNHTNRLDDVNTLIHEFGHAIHGKLLQEQAQAVYSPPLCLAETASIFSELLLGHHLQKELSQEEELQYLASIIEEAFGAIHRQTQYVLFERRVHQKIFDGEELSYEDLCRIWREEQHKMTGEMVEYDCPAEQESSWASIPHIFHTPFYCYTYAFGNLLSFSLYQKYREEGEDFKQAYKEILKAGSSEPPKELLARHGIDITKPEFFRDGLKILEDMVDQFEQLTK